MRLLTVPQQEATFLTTEVKKKYENLSGEELVITSYLARYEELKTTIQSKTSSASSVDIVSTGLLRKLLESGKRNEATKINRQFIDICYLFITDGQYDRAGYNETFGVPHDHPVNGADSTNEADPTNAAAPTDEPALTPETASIPANAPTNRNAASRHWPFKGQKIHFSARKDVFILIATVVTALLTWAIATNYQYLVLQIPSTAPKYLWWVAEYPDGTKVYNNFRRYRTEKEVIEHFMGLGLEDGSRNGDCNAIYWFNNNRVNVCYDSIETIQKFEEQHGGKPEIRFDG